MVTALSERRDDRVPVSACAFLRIEGENVGEFAHFILLIRITIMIECATEAKLRAARRYATPQLIFVPLL